MKFPQVVDGQLWYVGFNWLDPVVGRGTTPEQQRRNRLLRQALSIAIDWEEGYGRIFDHVGGAAAHGPVPPGNFGSREGQPGWHNPVTHHLVEGRVLRRPLAQARALMAEAGYPDGRDARSGKPLVLNYDYGKPASPERKAEIDWMVRQFAKLGVQLEIRTTDYNQFRDKMRRGAQQVYWWGWTPDYPDAENYLFLLTGPQSMARFDGSNQVNFQDDEYDRLYAELRTLDDGPRKQALVDRMVAIVQRDAPWSMGYFPYTSLAFQPWVHNGKPSIVIPDRIKYLRLDTAQRAELVAQWNRPVWWPLGLPVAAALALALAAWRGWRRRQNATGRRPGWRPP
jgi:ABC-type transport system substrate-binding protein